MTISQPRSGYTLPVFACAAAVAALRWLKQGSQPITSVFVDLLEPAKTVEISIEQVATLNDSMALAITRSDPGDNLDLTRNTPVWALVELSEQVTQAVGALTPRPEQILIKGGEGIGRHGAGGDAAIYAYARRLLLENLGRELEPEEKITVTIILPFGRSLATRTSNEAFGVVEGLSLLGTTGISEPLSAPGQLDVYREELQQKAGQFDCLVFCVGENGLDLASQLGVERARMVKMANWIGPLLVAAGFLRVKSILLFGYHGKLIKLAGGIFHTHHHLADGRLEILTAYCGQMGLPTPALLEIFASATADDAYVLLRDMDVATRSNWVDAVYGAIAAAIDKRSQAYIQTHAAAKVEVGSVLFDRKRQIIVKSEIGEKLLTEVC